MIIASSRELVTQALERPEAKRCGIYLLLGEDQGGEVAYVGETEELATRIRTHLARKAWWSDVALITTKSEDLNKAHIKYLESRIHEMIKAAGRVRLDNVAPR
ncbi:GIY-YIG nuclease family protein [Rubellimicrobium rubrum]|uniref:GIY-YIG nuclease family protein n=1 Tax=Rubellimicrobium rubrum TaxID=2585369 RepID=A0A5C4MTD3_9RHOB|nr:GIY-YIG nuclease family protein [Rubellimicrobium rubrum]TNC49307.1 GIY-YIG nuclease family protein [Rubellimicrobium rubrum]